MERREMLKQIALLTGGFVIGGEVFLSGCNIGPKAEAGFTTANIALLDEVGETIIPATSTPGAKAAKIGEFMKTFVTDCYTEDEQKVFTSGLAGINDACKKMHNKSFTDCDTNQRKEFLVSLEKEAKEFNAKRDATDASGKEAAKKAHTYFTFQASPSHYYTMMKQLTLLGFFTSKTGATETLRHIQVPGKFDGAYAYKKGDRAWAE